MKATILYRIAAILLVLFAAGHTVGFLTFTPPTAEGRAVLESMNKVHFGVSGATFSYGGFYTGFGLFVSAFLLFSALLAWHLGSLARRDSQEAAALGGSLFALQVVSLALSGIYFSLAPVVFSGLVAGFLAWATLLARARKA